MFLFVFSLSSIQINLPIVAKFVKSETGIFRTQIQTKRLSVTISNIIFLPDNNDIWLVTIIRTKRLPKTISNNLYNFNRITPMSYMACNNYKSALSKLADIRYQNKHPVMPGCIDSPGQAGRDRSMSSSRLVRPPPGHTRLWRESVS